MSSLRDLDVKERVCVIDCYQHVTPTGLAFVEEYNIVKYSNIVGELNIVLNN